MEENDYSLLKDVKLETNGTFSASGFTFPPRLHIPPYSFVRDIKISGSFQLHPGVTCSVSFLVLNVRKKLMLSPLVFLHQETPIPGDSTLWKEKNCASVTIEFLVNKWVHFGCMISVDFVRLHIDWLIVGEKPLSSTLNKDSQSDGSRKVSLACTHVEADENHDIQGYVHGVEDPPLQLSIDSLSASDIEEDNDGVWSIVGGKASCRRNLSFILLDALGQPPNKEVEVVSSLFYADSEAPVEKTNDAEAPLVTIYYGIQFASLDRPRKFINGHASFKLKISQLSSKCDNKLFRVKFDISKLGKYPFLETFSIQFTVFLEIVIHENLLLCGNPQLLP